MFGSARNTIAAIALGALTGAVLLPADNAHAGNGDAFAAGLLGGVVGAILVPPRYPVYAAPPPAVVYEAPAYVYPEPVYAPPPPVYYEPAYEPAYEYEYAPARRPLADIPRHRHRDRHRARGYDSGEPRVITYEDSVGGVASAGNVEPWSPGWHRYCRERFRSFDADTGTYMGYDGRRHFCTVK